MPPDFTQVEYGMAVKSGAAQRDRTLNRMRFAAVRLSAYGTKRTSRDVCYLSAFGGKADISRDCQPNHDL
jgi:hypothetical protein